MSAPEPAPLFDRGDTDQFSIADFQPSLDDEPLFQEDMPFEVRPVEGSDEPAERAATVPTGALPRDTKVDEIHADESATEVGDTQVRDTQVDHIEELSPRLQEEKLAPSDRRPAREKKRTSGSGPPLVEKKRAGQLTEPPQLEVADPSVNQTHLALAVAAIIAVIVYVGALAYVGADVLQPWWPASEAPAQVAGDDPGSEPTARRAP